METKTHYKKNIDPNWIGTFVLPEGKDIVVKLLNVTFQKGLTVAGKKKDSHVATFEKNPYFDKPMLLNPTNCKRLTVLSGTPYIELWKDLTVTLCQEMDRCISGGQDWALRIKAEKPTLPPLNKGTKAYENAVTYIRQGNTFDAIELKFSISEEVKKSITNDAT